MSTLSIVVLSVLAALISLLILAAIAGLIYAYLTTQRKLSTLIADCTTLISSTRTATNADLQRIELLIASVKGDQISKAAADILQAIPRQAAIAGRIETACITFGQVLKLITEDQGISGSALDRARESGLLPDSYAPAIPGDQPYVSRSRVAQGDAEALAEESANNSANSLGLDGLEFE